jgi:hypothetical protein
MSTVFNPFSGQLVLVPTPSTETAKATAAFFIVDWSLVGSEYVITVASTFHKITNPVATVYEVIGTDYQRVNVEILVKSNNDVLIKIDALPDNRFNGFIVIV